jgi:3-dehydroquinate dehydratase/shikimate dehydrogenase
MVERNECRMIKAAQEAEGKGADLVELRLDSLELTTGLTGRIFDNLAALSIPKIATIMPSTLFGGFKRKDEERASLLMEAADFVDYVDLGSEMGENLLGECLEGIKSSGARPIISWHSLKPLSLEEITSFVRSFSGRAVCKVVMPAERYSDNLVALNSCSSLEGCRRIVFCYGVLGACSRILSPFFGSEWAYASLKKGREGAPGQLDMMTMRRLQEAFI